MIASILLLALTGGLAGPRAAAAPSEAVAGPGEGRQEDALTERALYVSARTGSDTAGNGSQEAPWRSLHRALAALPDGAAAGRALIHVDVGRYDEASGEEFPLRVPAGVRIRGLTSTYTRVVAPEGSPALVLHSGERPIRLEDLGVEARSIAIRVRAGGAVVHLQDLDLVGSRVGVQVEEPPQAPALNLSMRSLRVRALVVGVQIQAPCGSRLDAQDCSLRGERIGLEWIDPPHEGQQPPQGGLALSRCSLQDASQAGLLRRATQPTRAAALRLDACRFERCGAGLSVESNSGAAPLWVQGSTFLENQSFGLRLVGGLPTDDPCRVEDCELRWNGVGLQLLSPRNPVHIQRCRVIDNLGAGISVGSFAPEPALTRLDSCLIADNGAAGVLALADGHQLLIELQSCTLTANHGAGLDNVSKRSGTASWAVRDCILAHEDGVEVRGLGPANFTSTLLSRRPTSEDWTDPLPADLWFADPGFTDPLNRDWGLRQDSPARGRASRRTAAHHDLQGVTRPAEGADLGALQSGGGE